MAVKVKIPTPELSPRALIPAMLRSGWWQARRSGWRMFLLYMAFQGLTAVVALPLIRWIFGEVLRSAGLHGVDLNTFSKVFTVPLSLAWLVVLVLLALLVMSLQLAVLLLASARSRVRGGFDLRELGLDVVHLTRKALRPSSWPLLVYLFVILPLSQFGFLSALTRAIAIPAFITGELEKSSGGTALVIAFFVVLFFVNVRLSLVVPLFALTDASGVESYRSSWRLTWKAFPSLVVSMIVLFAAANFAGVTLIIVGTLPTLLTDVLSPNLSPVMAAAGLAFAEVVGLLMVGFTIMILCGVLLELLHRALALAPNLVLADHLLDNVPSGASTPEDASRRGLPRGARRARAAGHRGAWLIAGALTVAILALAAVNVPVMKALQVQPDTLVLAHRGFTEGAVENTIPALEAAAKAGADLVEMDVMEAKDGGFVVMHDANLKRLTGVDAGVGDLTLAEITALEAVDSAGNRASVPSLQEYLMRAQELGMPLLVEIKLHGGEKPSLVPRLIAEMESLDAFEGNIFHSLSKASVEELKAMRPAAYAGYIMALAGVEIPQTSADFVVVEEWSYTTELRDDAWNKGKEIFTWTVNDDGKQRLLLREEVDGMITDHPVAALESRTEIGSDDGLFDTLWDAIDKFVTVF